MRYIRNGREIYDRSFATIRREADLDGLPDGIEAVAVRMIHTCGMVDIPADLAFSADVVKKGRAALRAGAPEHHRLAGARPLGLAATAPGYTLLDLGDHPGLVAAGEGIVHGELYAAGAPLLARLDRYEDCPRLFRRATVRLAGGREALAYLLAPEHARDLPAIPSGDWLRHLRRR